MNSNKNKKIVFGNVSPIISAILKKYGLGETDEEIFEKYLREETTISATVARLLYEVAAEIVPLKQFPYELQKQLNIPLEKASNMALELQKKVLIFAREVPATEGIEKRPTTMIKPAPKEFREKPQRIRDLKEEEEPIPNIPKYNKLRKKTKDVYRETVE